MTQVREAVDLKPGLLELALRLEWATIVFGSDDSTVFSTENDSVRAFIVAAVNYVREMLAKAPSDVDGGGEG